MKLAYLEFDGWNIEVPITVGGKSYRIDVYSVTGKAREFVHSLSPHYVEKHIALKESGLDVLWVFDGSKFVSARFGYVRGQYGLGYKRLLKPTASRVFYQTGGLVHWNDLLWKEWKHYAFFPCKGQASDTILSNYGKALARVAEMRKAA